MDDMMSSTHQLAFLRLLGGAPGALVADFTFALAFGVALALGFLPDLAGGLPEPPLIDLAGFD